MVIVPMPLQSNAGMDKRARRATMGACGIGYLYLRTGFN